MKLLCFTMFIIGVMPFYFFFCSCSMVVHFPILWKHHFLVTMGNPCCGRDTGTTGVGREGNE